MNEGTFIWNSSAEKQLRADKIPPDCDMKIQRNLETADGMYNIEVIQRRDDRRAIKRSTSHDRFMSASRKRKDMWRMEWEKEDKVLTESTGESDKNVKAHNTEIGD